MLNDTQIQIVKNRLETNGKISRNECLREYISRLGAIINVLKNRGWEFDAKYIETKSPYSGRRGRDYVYYLTKKGE